MSQPEASLVDSQYAKRAKDLIALNKEIESLSRSNFELNLPKIAVIGDQSSGKSSLVEAISKITVPRDDGTCTRCPMECTMTTDPSWSCTLYLQKDFDNNGRPLPSRKQKKVDFGPVITDSSKLELWIRRAQAAILLPDQKESEFYDMTVDMIKTALNNPNALSFSRNIVGVEVKSPHSIPLTFVDLPGIIHHDSKNQENVKLVSELVKSSIAGGRMSNTVILLVIAMTGDMEVQAVNTLAKEFDPEGMRTVGVLTKPDLVGSGSTGMQNRWSRILEGKEGALKHGYYCVRLPDDEQRKLGTAAFETIVKDYFDSTAPWSNVVARNRFGVQNLVSNLSKLLVDLIESNLPKLRKQVKTLLEKYRAELDALPSPPKGHPGTRMRRLIDQFLRAVHEVVMGESHRQECVQKNRKIFAIFKEEIWKTGIAFIPYTIEPPRNCSQWIDLHARHDEVFNDKSVPQFEKIIERSFPPFQKSLDLNEVKDVINRSIGWELHGHVPFAATIDLVQMSTDQWPKPAEKCFLSIFDNSWKVFDSLIQDIFQNHDKIRQRVKTLTRKEYEACRENAQKSLQQALKKERFPLHTQNHHYFSSQKALWKTRFTAACNWNSTLSRDYEAELELMATAHAYWKVTFKRFTDDIPRLIEHQLNQALDENLSERLLEDISSDEAEMLMAENPEIEENRTRLEDLVQRLEDVERLVGSYTDGEAGDTGCDTNPPTPIPEYPTDTDPDNSDGSRPGSRLSVQSSPGLVLVSPGPRGVFSPGPVATAMAPTLVSSGWARMRPG